VKVPLAAVCMRQCSRTCQTGQGSKSYICIEHVACAVAENRQYSAARIAGGTMHDTFHIVRSFDLRLCHNVHTAIRVSENSQTQTPVTKKRIMPSA